MSGTKSVLYAGVLGCASLLALPEPVNARGGVGIGIGIGGPNFYFYAGPRYYGYGPYYYPYAARYYGVPYRYGYPPPYYYASGIMLPPLPARPSYYYYSPPPSPYYYGYPQPPQPAPPANYSARVQINVPDPNASIWFDGQKTQATGTVRSFDTPPLEPGKAYSYKIRASWMQGGQQVTQERAVPVSAGQTRVVDFTRPAD